MNYKSYLGITLVILGVLMLTVGYALGWTDSNVLLLTAAAMVVAGAVLHVYMLKKESKY